MRENVPWVRIPPSPNFPCICLDMVYIAQKVIEKTLNTTDQLKSQRYDLNFMHLKNKGLDFIKNRVKNILHNCRAAYH